MKQLAHLAIALAIATFTLPTLANDEFLIINTGPPEPPIEPPTETPIVGLCEAGADVEHDQVLGPKLCNGLVLPNPGIGPDFQYCTCRQESHTIVIDCANEQRGLVVGMLPVDPNITNTLGECPDEPTNTTAQTSQPDSTTLQPPQFNYLDLLRRGRTSHIGIPVRATLLPIPQTTTGDPALDQRFLEFNRNLIDRMRLRFDRKTEGPIYVPKLDQPLDDSDL